MIHVTVEPMHQWSALPPAVNISFSATIAKPKARLGFPIIPRQARITVAEIQRMVAAHYGLSQAELISDRRYRSVARPRQVAMWVARQLTPRSLPDIGRRFGNRDHTTVLHALRRIESLKAEDPNIERDCEYLIAQLGGRPE